MRIVAWYAIVVLKANLAWRRASANSAKRLKTGVVRVSNVRDREFVPQTTDEEKVRSLEIKPIKTKND